MVDEEQAKELRRKIDRLEEELRNVKGSECEVYSRIVGFFRPLKNWNEGKVAEFKDRVTFNCYGGEEIL